MREAVTFYRSFHEAIQEEEDPMKRLQAYEAILNYALYGMEPEEIKGIAKAAFIVAKPVIDSSNKACENGKKGGAPKGNQNARKKQEEEEKQPKQPPLFFENNPGLNNQTNNDNENDNDNDNENNNKKVVLKKPKTKFHNFDTRDYNFKELEKISSG